MGKLHNEELIDFYSSPSIFWVNNIEIEMGRACNAYGREESRILGFGRDT